MKLREPILMWSSTRYRFSLSYEIPEFLSNAALYWYAKLFWWNMINFIAGIEWLICKKITYATRPPFMLTE